MPKVWIFRETEEVRIAKRGEWIKEPLTGEFIHCPFLQTGIELPILSLQVLDHDPLEPIREVYERFKHLDRLLGDAAWCSDDVRPAYAIAGELYRACKKAVEVEGK
jgi:hypothetical protein